MNKINNPYLKQLISEIANKTAEGRITGISWGLIDEAKKKKTLKKEAEEPKKDAAEEPAADAGGLPPLGGADETPKDAPKDAPANKAEEPKKGAAPEAGAEPASPDDSGEDTDKAKEDATKAKAELEKAKAEKDQAEKEIKKQSYVSLGSSSGTQFLLGKVLDHAFKTNTIDALAGEMVEKLKITTPDDVDNFSEDVATYMAIPGMPQLLSSMKTLATKQPAKTEEPSA